ncbi:MAG: hypothetical protein OEW11_04930 [Nitrospirota bacterium]|nr:hypothetical protein [Nitrospirota bacterium]
MPHTHTARILSPLTPMARTIRGIRTIRRTGLLGLVGLVGLSALIATSAAAEPLPGIYQGTRPMGMGGAFTAVADDYNAMVYNPAGLAWLDGFNLDPLNAEVQLSTDALDLQKDLDGVNSTDLVAVTDVLRLHMGEQFRVSAGSFPHVVFRGFGFGVLGQASVQGVVHSSVNPRVDVRTQADAGGMLSFAHSYGGGRVAAGLTAKYFRRAGSFSSGTAVDIAAGTFDPLASVKDSVKSDGALDLGVMYRPELPLKPTFAVAALNLGDLNYGPALGSVPYQVNLGLAFQPQVGPLHFVVAADVQDVTKNLSDDGDWVRRTHLGAETRLWRVLAVRAGYGQGYMTAGATLNLWVVRLDVATYTEEMGAYGGQNGDRRYIARLNFF